jgi:hypothetical protein
MSLYAPTKPSSFPSSLRCTRLESRLVRRSVGQKISEIDALDRGRTSALSKQHVTRALQRISAASEVPRNMSDTL